MPPSHSADLILLTDPHAPAAEAYRTLRTNLQFSTVEHPVQTLVVTAAGPVVGRAAIAANLAVTVAQANRRVILVDADLRQPRQHELFGVANGAGLADVLQGAQPVATPPLVEVGVAGLRLLPAGTLPPNPADLLARPQLAELLAALKAQADMVIVDTPPVVSVTDGLIVGAQADGVLLVVSAQATKRQHAQQAKALLAKVNARLVGAVLNNVAASAAFQRY